MIRFSIFHERNILWQTMYMHAFFHSFLNCTLPLIKKHCLKIKAAVSIQSPCSLSSATCRFYKHACLRPNRRSDLYKA